MSLDQPFVSIVIPTYKDWNRLLMCIAALKNQTYPADAFEVIIVNNDPADRPPVKVLNALPANFQLIDESKSGSYAARNAALKRVKGRFIGFTDSDCIPDKNWITNAVDLFHSKGCSRIAGKIELFFEDSLKPTSAELYEAVYAFKQDEVVAKLNSGVTGNMFTKMEVISEVGSFNENLLSGGDHEWSGRAEAKGHKIVYAENVLIFHPARKHLKDLVKKTKRIAGGGTDFRNANLLRKIWIYVSILRPRLSSIIKIEKNGANFTLSQKLTVFLVRNYLEHVSRLEKMLVSFGKPSNRE